MKIKVDGFPDLAFDPRSGAVININKKEILQAKQRKSTRMAEKERINKLENDVSEIKSLLKDLIGKL
jgi:hypothetical protein